MDASEIRKPDVPILRYALMMFSFVGALAALWQAHEFKFWRPQEAGILLGVAAVLVLVFLYTLTVRPQPKDGSEPRPSVFRLVGLWMRAKEKDLAARAKD
jgi:type II secretory pathway component PulM